MQALAISGHGGMEKVRLETLPQPSCPPDKVLVKLKAASLNHLDLFVRQGLPGVQLTFPHVLGSDGAGTLAEVGKQVQAQRLRVKAGDAVIINPNLSCGKCGFCLAQEESLCSNLQVLGEHTGGTYCTHLAVPPENLWPLPPHLSMEEGAAFPLTFVTAWRMLITKAQLKRQHTVLIQGIGGGVALAALAIAKAWGCRVLVTSRSPEKLKKATALGADHGYLAGSEAELSAMIQKVRGDTGKRGVDVIIDSVGPATWKTSIAMLARDGRLACCGATTGRLAELDLNRLFWNQISIFGSTLGSRRDFQAMWDFLVAKRLKVCLDQTLPLNRGIEALRRLESGQQMGKIVLTVT